MPLQRWLTTTPGRLRTASIALVAGLVILAVVAVAATNARHRAAEDVAARTVPALVASEELYKSLADADATASRIFLLAGLEPPELRQRYHDQLHAAGRQLATVADAADISPAAQRAVQTITTQLPVYTELVGEARFNSRQGFPVGARYLHDASELMRVKILPAATEIYRDTSARLDDNYSSGTAPGEIVVVALAGLVLILVLAGVQVFVTRRTRRVFNVALVAATVLVVVVLIGTVAQFLTSQGALGAARDDGSDTVELVAAARILTLRAAADESFALIERGTGGAFYDDFDVVVPRVRGVLRTAARTGTAEARRGATDAATQFAAFVDAHHDVRDLDQGGQYFDAVKASTGSEGDAQAESQADRVGKLDTTYAQIVGDARSRLEAHASDARAGFGVLTFGIPLLLAGAIALVLVGLQRRIREYR